MPASDEERENMSDKERICGKDNHPAEVEPSLFLSLSALRDDEKDQKDFPAAQRGIQKKRGGFQNHVYS